MEITAFVKKQNELMATLSDAVASFREENPDIRIDHIFYDVTVQEGVSFRSSMSVLIEGAQITRSTS